MSKYTTGDMAKLCGVSVRTVQYYDTKGLLIPSELTEGGRRLYLQDDLKQMRLILMLKSLGLALESIKGILESETPEKVLILLLDEQAKRIDCEIDTMQKQRRAIDVVKENIRSTEAISVNSINDIEQIMKGNKKLRAAKITMLIVGIIMDFVQIGTIWYWIKYGSWVPFAVGMPFVILAAILLVRTYYINSAYICAECNAKFKPKFWEFFFAGHTPKTRKLTCTECGHKGWCVETGAE